MKYVIRLSSKKKNGETICVIVVEISPKKRFIG